MTTARGGFRPDIVFGWGTTGGRIRNVRRAPA